MHKAIIFASIITLPLVAFGSDLDIFAHDSQLTKQIPDGRILETSSTDAVRLAQSCKPYCDVLFAPKATVKTAEELAKFPENWEPVLKQNLNKPGQVYRSIDGRFIFGDTKEEVALNNGQPKPKFQLTKFQGVRMGLPANTPEGDAFYYVSVPEKFDSANPDFRAMTLKAIPKDKGEFDRQLPIIFVNSVQKYRNQAGETTDIVARNFVDPKLWASFFEPEKQNIPISTQPPPQNDQSDQRLGPQKKSPPPQIKRPRIMPRRPPGCRPGGG